jgi:hypothetical protein
MPALGIERELDKDLAALHPRSRYQDLAIWLRRLTIESPGPIPDDTLLQSADGVTLRVRTTEGAVIAASLPPGASAALQDGAALTWEGGQAQLRVEVVARFGGIWDHKESRFIPGEPKQPLIFDGRNLFDPALVHSLGIEYHAIGRGEAPREEALEG